MRLATPIAIVAVLAAVFLYLRLSSLEERLDRTVEEMRARAEPIDDGTHFELAVSMGRIQRFHEKLWAAGDAGNAELAAFYLHELEEAMEEVEDAKLVDEGVDISAKMGAYGTKVVEALQNKLRSEGVQAMHGEAELLVNTCNSCHRDCGYPFLRIKVPEKVNFTDQEFSPVERAAAAE